MPTFGFWRQPPLFCKKQQLDDLDSTAVAFKEDGTEIEAQLLFQTVLACVQSAEACLAWVGLRGKQYRRNAGDCSSFAAVCRTSSVRVRREAGLHVKKKAADPADDATCHVSARSQF